MAEKCLVYLFFLGSIVGFVDGFFIKGLGE